MADKQVTNNILCWYESQPWNSACECLLGTSEVKVTHHVRVTMLNSTDCNCWIPGRVPIERYCFVLSRVEAWLGRWELWQRWRTDYLWLLSNDSWSQLGFCLSSWRMFSFSFAISLYTDEDKLVNRCVTVAERNSLTEKGLDSSNKQPQTVWA